MYFFIVHFEALPTANLFRSKSILLNTFTGFAIAFEFSHLALSLISVILLMLVLSIGLIDYVHALR